MPPPGVLGHGGTIAGQGTSGRQHGTAGRQVRDVLGVAGGRTTAIYAISLRKPHSSGHHGTGPDPWYTPCNVGAYAIMLHELQRAVPWLERLVLWCCWTGKKPTYWNRLARRKCLGVSLPES